MDDRNRCSSCKFWNQESNYDYGKCKKVREGIDIIVHYGWEGGYVEYVETDATFGCVFHIPK